MHFEEKTLMLNKKLKIRKKSKDKEKGFERKTAKETERIDENKLLNSRFCCSLPETKAEKDRKKQEDQIKEAK